jgi:hypothetical protein
MVNRRYIQRLDFIGPKGEQIQARVVYDYCELALLRCTGVMKALFTTNLNARYLSGFSLYRHGPTVLYIHGLHN